MRLSRAEARRFRLLSQAATEQSSPEELGHRLGALDGRAALALRASLYRETQIDATNATRIDTGAGAVFPLSGGDLTDRFRGPALGAALRYLERRWIVSGFTLDKTALITQAQTLA